MKHKNVLLAGATGYLGSYLLQELLEKQNQVIAVVRNPKKLRHSNDNYLEVKQAEVTDPNTIRDICKGVHTMISTVGITRQKDGLSYMDVDYQANINLLKEAKRAGVKHFVYISAINGDKHRNLKIFEAKEKFVDALKSSGLNYSVVRPNGFFSDMKDFLQMAKSGRIYLFGSGHQSFNPIHGEDLARAIVDMLDGHIKEIDIGGPDILSLNDISKLAAHALNNPVRTIHLPAWMRQLTLWFLRTFTSAKTYGPIEFFLTLMATDNIAPKYGSHRLKDYFLKENQNSLNS